MPLYPGPITKSTLIPHNRGLIINGDSLYQHNTSNIDGSGNWNAVTRYGNRLMAYGMIWWLRFLCYVSFDLDGTGNNGKVGDTTEASLARLKAILDTNPAATVIIGPSPNDRGAAAFTLARSQAAIKAQADMVHNTGRVCIVHTGTPAGGLTVPSNRMSAAQLGISLALRDWVIETYSSLPGFVVADTMGALIDPASTTGDVLPNMFYDDLHPGPAGAYALAVVFKPIFDMLFLPRAFFGIAANTDVYDATNNPTGSLLLNPTMQGSNASGMGTGGSGFICDSWSGGNGGDTGHTRVYSKVSGKQQVVFGGTPTSNADAAALIQTITAGNLSVGDVIRGFSTVEIDAGVTGIDSFRLRLVNTTGFVNAAVDGDYSGSMFYWPTVAVKGAFLTPPAVIPATTIRLEQDARLKSGVACAATIRIINMGAIKVA